LIKFAKQMLYEQESTVKFKAWPAKTR